MACPLCEEFCRKYPLTEDDGELVHILENHEDGNSLCSPISCAFENSHEFSSDNWCCETMSLLRQLFWSEKILSTWHNDSNAGIVPIPITDDPEEECGIQQGFLVMTGSYYE